MYYIKSCDGHIVKVIILWSWIWSNLIQYEVRHTAAVSQCKWRLPSEEQFNFQIHAGLEFWLLTFGSTQSSVCEQRFFSPHYEPRFLQIIVHTIFQLPNYLSNLRRWLHSRVHLPVYPPHLLCNSHNRAKCLLLSQHNADICFNPKLSLKTAFFSVFEPCHGMATCSFSHFKPWFLQWKWWLPCTLPPLVIQKCTWPDSTCDSHNLKTGLNFDCRLQIGALLPLVHLQYTLLRLVIQKCTCLAPPTSRAIPTIWKLGWLPLGHSAVRQLNCLRRKRLIATKSP